MNTTAQIKTRSIPPGSIGLWWLGQSGYALKNSSGEILYIDPYLTDTISAGYRPYIHARLIPPVVDPGADIPVISVLLTHDHQDHLDPNSIVILSEEPKVRFFGSAPVRQKLTEVLDIPADSVQALETDESTVSGGYRVTATKAVHSGGAVGYIIQSEGLTLYFSGDTILFAGMKAIGQNFPLDYAFLCINGQQGNMDCRSAIHAAKLLHPRTIIPNHYGMYADNTVDPEKFAYLLAEQYPHFKCLIAQPGELIILKPE